MGTPKRSYLLQVEESEDEHEERQRPRDRAWKEVRELLEELNTSKYIGILARGIVEGADERSVGEKGQIHSSSDKLEETYANVSATDHMRGIIAKALARLELSVSCKQLSTSSVYEGTGYSPQP